MRTSLAFVVAGLVACGRTVKVPEGPGGGGGGSAGTARPQTPGDVSFELPAQEIKGMTFEPDALIGNWGMPLVESKKKTTIDKQRQTYDKTKDLVQKQAHAAVLATMLYQKGKDAKGDEQTQLFSDARAVLRDVAGIAGDKVDELTLRLLGSYELLLGDHVAAEKAWSGLVKAAPKDKELLTHKAWHAYSLLKQYKNAEAVAALPAEAPSEKTPELAYVTAWAKWRTGDLKGAWTALLAAAKGWGSMPGRDALERDIFLFAGRAGVSLDDAVAGLTPVFGKASDQQYALLAKLGLQAYQFAGRWKDGVAALDKALALVGAKAPVDDRPVIRYTQADYTVRLDDPAAAAKFAGLALEALPACGAKCSDQDKANLVQSVYITGRLFHVLYASAHDDRYYQPAHDLYAAALPKLIDDKMRAEAQRDADFLEKTFKTIKAGVGTHEKGAIGALLGRHNQEVQACYELGLQRDPKLSGTLVLTLESDQTGVIKGASTEPAAGADGMAMVAGCASEAARTWKLPSRAQAGSTRIRVPYTLGKR